MLGYQFCVVPLELAASEEHERPNGAVIGDSTIEKHLPSFRLRIKHFSFSGKSASASSQALRFQALHSTRSGTIYYLTYFNCDSLHAKNIPSKHINHFYSFSRAFC